MAKLESAVSPLAGRAPAPVGPGAPSHGQLVTKERIRLVIAEGHQIVRLGLERFLGSIEDFTVVATATGSPASLVAVRAPAADGVVLDNRLSGRSGLEDARHILMAVLATPSVALPRAV